MVVVYYDLETTGLNNQERQRGVQIVSIGAVTEYGATFHRYIIPTCEISEEATNVHSGLTCFMDWLSSQNADCLVKFNIQPS